MGLWQLTITGGADLGGSITIGHNNGQWNFGFWASAGEGLSVEYAPLNLGCAPTGTKTGFRGTRSFKIGTEGASVGFEVGGLTGLSFQRSIPTGTGVDISSSTTGEVTPTIGAGGSGFLGWGFHSVW